MKKKKKAEKNNRILNPIKKLKKLCKKKRWHHSFIEDTFVSTMGFEEFNGINAGVQVRWHNNTHLTALLVFDYEPKLADVHDFKSVINNLNDELWGVTYVWHEENSQLVCKVIEAPETFTMKDADAFFEMIYRFGHALLDRVYPRDPKEQERWQEHMDQRTLLEEGAVMGTA